MIRAFSFGWFGDFGEILTTIHRSSHPVVSAQEVTPSNDSNKALSNDLAIFYFVTYIFYLFYDFAACQNILKSYIPRTCGRSSLPPR